MTLIGVRDGVVQLACDARALVEDREPSAGVALARQSLREHARAPRPGAGRRRPRDPASHGIAKMATGSSTSAASAPAIASGDRRRRAEREECRGDPAAPIGSRCRRVRGEQEGTDRRRRSRVAVDEQRLAAVGHHGERQRHQRSRPAQHHGGGREQLEEQRGRALSGERSGVERVHDAQREQRERQRRHRGTPATTACAVSRPRRTPPRRARAAAPARRLNAGCRAPRAAR